MKNSIDLRMPKSAKQRVFWFAAALFGIFILLVILGAAMHIYASYLYSDANNFVKQLTEQAHNNRHEPWECQIDNVGICVLYANAKKQLDEVNGLIQVAKYFLILGGVGAGWTLLSGITVFFWPQRPEEIVLNQTRH